MVLPTVSCLHTKKIMSSYHAKLDSTSVSKQSELHTQKVSDSSRFKSDVKRIESGFQSNDISILFSPLDTLSSGDPVQFITDSNGGVTIRTGGHVLQSITQNRHMNVKKEDNSQVSKTRAKQAIDSIVKNNSDTTHIQQSINAKPYRQTFLHKL
jgi:hypothetical protein